MITIFNMIVGVPLYKLITKDEFMIDVEKIKNTPKIILNLIKKTK